MATLLGPRDIRGLAETLGLHPAKHWGQNFVVDAGTVRKIARLAGVGPGDHVLEVGPGFGSLTLALLETGAEVTAVEIDPRLAATLAAVAAEHAPDDASRLAVIHADALRVSAADVEDARAGSARDARAGSARDARAGRDGDRAGRDGDRHPAPRALVANLPYNVAVPVILTALETFAGLERVLVMVQAEVADRIAAPPGSRTYGIPSAKVAWYGSARRAGNVGRAAFWPVPRVDSALVLIERRDPPVTSARREDVFAVVDAAFAQRRKAMRGVVRAIAGSPEAGDAALERAGVDPLARGETLDIATFARLTEALHDFRVGG